MGHSFVPSATAYCLLFPRFLKLGVLSCTERRKVASAVSASSSSSFKRKSQRTSLASVVTCCYSKINLIILNLNEMTYDEWLIVYRSLFLYNSSYPHFYVHFFYSLQNCTLNLLQPNHIFRSVMPDHTLSFLNCRSHFSTDVVLTPLVSRLGSSNRKISIGYQITCLLLSFLRLLILSNMPLHSCVFHLFTLCFVS